MRVQSRLPATRKIAGNFSRIPIAESQLGTCHATTNCQSIPRRCCPISAIKEQARRTEALTGKVVDVDKEYRDCVRRVMEMAEHARQAAYEQQAFNRMLLIGVVAAVIGAMVLTELLYRLP
ncbi:hypothetical protein [Rhizobium mongolense]|uniref:Uncharacterized protein n=2 Tax=Rhizobium mongolense TaxID=57676 RepID=A0ABR6INA0_9HYPH|nr:hypothetical protein [Rhizobium mongolense]MBB4229321.1 hypothetical protein [Rhizobium mongolense]